MGVTYANGQLPLPNGSYWWGVGPVYVPGYSPVIEEWSASKSPYYTYGDPVLHKGLVYYLNYAWDGTTVGAPDSQVDGSGNRTWSLWTGGGEEQYYYKLQLKNLLNGPTTQWGLRPCHTLFYNIFGTVLDECMILDDNPKAYYTPPGGKGAFSADVGAGASIPSNLFKFVQTDGASHPSSDVGNLVGGIFDSLKDYPYQSGGQVGPLGALYYEETFSYTLTEKNWWMNPEYDDSGAVNRTFTYTDTSGATVNRVKLMWMIFIPHTFKDRTYNGAFRVYRTPGYPNVLIERFELDTVTPDLLTD